MDTDSASGTDVPVTVVCGPLGAGKTTLVNRLLENPSDWQLAVVVNDMGEVNVDAELLGDAEDGVVDLSNGCICCRLEDDLHEQLENLGSRDVDAIVVEASGISEPVPIAQTLTGAGDEGPPGGVRLDTMVSVIDAYGFWKEFDADESVPEAASDLARPLADILVDAIEFCDVLLLNKCDMVPDEAVDELTAIARRLQPRASIYQTEYSNVDTGTVVDTGLFDYGAARRQQGWKRALAGDADHDHGDARGHDGDHDGGAPTRHGVESLVYERSTPFHPERFDRWLDDWDDDIVRAKGFAWVASRPGEVIGMSQAGPSVQAGPIGEWGEDDPTTRLVFIGTDLDGDGLRGELDGCLVTEAERDATWTDDPFPREA